MPPVTWGNGIVRYKLTDGRKNYITINKNNMRQMLYFTAPWCGPCQQLGPIIDEISNANPGRIKKVNIDYDPELPHRYNIKSIPTTIIFEGEVEIERKVGIQPRNYYIQALQLN